MLPVRMDAALQIPLAGMFGIVAVHAEQLPVAAVGRVVVVVVVLVVDRQLAQARPCKLASAAATDVRIQLQRKRSVGALVGRLAHGSKAPNQCARP